MKEFKDILRELRLKAGLPQSQLAEQIYVSRSAIAKYENGLGLPCEETLERLCNLFQVQKADFFPPKEEALLVAKNRSIRKLKWTICAILAAIVIAVIAVCSVLIGTRPIPPGGNRTFTADHLPDSSLSDVVYCNVGSRKIASTLVYRSEDGKIVIPPEGCIWSTDGMVDVYMGYTHFDSLILYMVKGMIRIPYEDEQIDEWLSDPDYNPEIRLDAEVLRYAEEDYTFYLVNETDDNVILDEIVFYH